MLHKTRSWLKHAPRHPLKLARYVVRRHLPPLPDNDPPGVLYQPSVVYLGGDNPTRHVTRQVLEYERYRVYCTDSEGDALAFCRYNDADLLVVSISRLDEDALAMLARLRADEFARDMPLIVMGGFSDPALERQLPAVGVNEYLLSPIDIDHLLELVRRHTHERRAPNSGTR